MAERITVGQTARAGWDDLLKLVTSLKAGYGSASTIIDLHGSAARGMPVSECGTVPGKVPRTLFMLNYLVNPTFQHAIHPPLNPGESVSTEEQPDGTHRCRHGN